MSGAREFDVLCWGSTGFTGGLVAEYMASRLAGGLRARVALGGRDAARLEALRARLVARHGEAAATLGIVAARAEAPEAAVARARVVLSTVGPFTLLGEPLVRACVEAGAGYVDITGESPWVRMLIDRYHERARQTGARIVNMCGFDSVPADLGALYAYRAARARFPGERVVRIDAYVRMSGDASGGTVASMAEGLKDRNTLRQIQSPYLLNPDGHVPPRAFAAEDRDVMMCHYAHDVRGWAGPFVMASVNTRVVRRSMALMAAAPDVYGGRAAADAPAYIDHVHYQEYHLMSSLFKMLLLMGGMFLFVLGMSLSVSRWALRKLLPKPGQGPSDARRAASFFRYTHVAKTDAGHSVSAVVAGGDPGYTETAKMVSEAALCLAFDADRLPRTAGVLTPATAMGSALIERLQQAGMTFEVQEPEPSKIDG